MTRSTLDYLTRRAHTRALRRRIRHELYQAKYAQGQEEMTLELLNQRRSQTTDKAQTLDDRLASVVYEDEEEPVDCQLEETTNRLVFRHNNSSMTWACMTMKQLPGTSTSS